MCVINLAETCKYLVSSLERGEIGRVAAIAGQWFKGYADHYKACEIIGAKRKNNHYYVVVEVGKEAVTLGYILWREKGGKRDEVVLELEQVAMKKGQEGKGIGSELIKGSFRQVERVMKERGSVINSLEVTTGVTNKAKNLYPRVFKEIGFLLTVEFVVPDYWGPGRDEAFMFFKRAQ